LVVALDPAMNDLHDSVRPDWDPTTYHLAVSAPTPRFMDWLAGQSRLVAVLSGKFSPLEPVNARDLRERRVALRRERPVLEPPPETLARGIPRFQANQRRMLRLLGDEGIPCVLMTEPTLLKEKLSPQEDAVVHSVVI